MPHYLVIVEKNTTLLFYTGDGPDSSNRGFIATIDYVYNTLKDILEPLQPIDPSEASIGTLYIVGKDNEGNKRTFACKDEAYVNKLSNNVLSNAKIHTEERILSSEEKMRGEFSAADNRVMEWVKQNYQPL